MRWYKQDGGLFDRLWAKDPKAVSLYVYLHIAAYVNDSKLYGQIIRRGSCLVKYESISERTGLTISEIRLRLKLLSDCGEVILNRTNRGLVVTVCDYDSCNTSEDMFSTNSTIQPQSNRNLTTIQPQPNDNHINIEYKNIDIRNSEREGRRALVLEIKDIYNHTFSGQLIEWKRLSEKMMMKVETCVMRYGRQSVDWVFDQVKHEPFSMGDNTSGFRADFDFIFRLDQYEKYLERYKLRMAKKDQPEAQTKKPSKKPANQPQQTSFLDRVDETPKQTAQEKRKELLEAWVKAEANNSTERGQAFLTECYNSGELARFGIEWKPTNL